MNLALVIAGSLALLGATVHGGGGEIWVVRKLSPKQLPSTLFGGPMMTKAMIRVSWHITTIAFLTVGVALVLSGSVLDGDTGRAVAVLAAAASTGIGLLTALVALGQFRRALASRTTDRRELRSFLHPGPVILLLIPVLAWIGLA